MEDASMLYVEKQIVAGINFKVTLATSDRTLHFIKFHIPPGKKDVHVLQRQSLSKNSVLVDQSKEDLKSEIQKDLLNYYTHKFSGGDYKFLGFKLFDIYKGEDAKVIHCISKIKDSTKAFNVMETFFIKKDKFKVESYMHGGHSLVKGSDEKCKGHDESMFRCLSQPECSPDSVHEFSKCIQNPKQKKEL